MTCRFGTLSFSFVCTTAQDKPCDSLTVLNARGVAVLLPLTVDCAILLPLTVYCAILLQLTVDCAILLQLTFDCASAFTCAAARNWKELVNVSQYTEWLCFIVTLILNVKAGSSLSLILCNPQRVLSIPSRLAWDLRRSAYLSGHRILWKSYF